MRIGRATGLQIAFLMFAVMLVAVPMSRLLVKAGLDMQPWRGVIEQGAHFALAIVLIVAFPRLRRFALDQLATPLPRTRWKEVLAVSLAKLTLAFAATAVLAVHVWLTEGTAGMPRLLVDADAASTAAFSERGLVRLFLAVLVAPVVEELICRGFIYRAFEAQWGWFPSMMLTSAVFGLYHPYFWSAFASALVYTCLLRRSGTLWAPILAHALFNLMLWWPLLGQHVFPHGVPLQELAAWRVHLASLVFMAVALPTYVWMSRDRHVAAIVRERDSNAPLPQ